MGKSYDVIVIGVGGVGSSVACHLARRKKRVLGLERFSLAHDRGSSHGVNRIIRRPYYKGQAYVPLVSRAYELWRELESEAGEQLLHITGGLDVGPRDSATVQGALAACERFGLLHELLDAPAITARFPAFSLPQELFGVYQPDGGFVMSERAILAHARIAQNWGAEIHENEPVLQWSIVAGQVHVETPRGNYEADRLVIAAGAWIADLVPELARLAAPERQVVGWFTPPEPKLFDIGRFPVFTMSVDEGEFYGFPQFGRAGFKFARHHHLGEAVSAEAVDRSTNAGDEVPLRTALEKYFPAGAGPASHTSVCLYTNTPDEDFIIDLHPDHPEALLLSPCSGHGYKFCSVIGEIAAALLVDNNAGQDIGFLSLDRFRRND
jgi:sarcosine oxidase